jgi:hypothetical protein
MLGHRWPAPSFRLGTVAALLLCNAACTATPPPSAAVSAADAGALVPAARYRSVMMATETLRPVEPQPWQDLNRKVAPPPPNPKGREP